MGLMIKDAFDAEMASARSAYMNADYVVAFERLKRAHILGQRNLFRHWSTHWWMLRLGLRLKDKQEVVGQLVRLMAVVPGFMLGWIPVGNTGTSAVSALKPMPLPDDLAQILGRVSVWRDVLLRGVLLGMAVLLFVLW